MSLSFAGIFEAMMQDRAQKSPLMDSGLESKALQVVRAGKELRGEDDSSFWEDFIQLLSNSEGIAELFGVSPEKVATWPHRIKETLDQLESDQQQSSPEKVDTELAPTGDNGGVAATNQDPPIEMPQ